MLLRKLLTTVLGGGTPFTPILFDRVLNGHMAYTPPTGYTGWFVLEDEVIEL